MNNEAIELAERNIKSAEDSLRKAREQLNEAKRAKSGHVTRFISLTEKHGYCIAGADGRFQPRMDGGVLRVQLPQGNGKWACAVMKAAAEFCDGDRNGYPCVRPGMEIGEIWIQCKVQE